MNKIDILKGQVMALARKIDVLNTELPVYGTNDSAHPYIEIDSNGNYNYVIRERGEEYERKVFLDSEIDELLYTIFSSITSMLAGEYELRNRIPNQDSRILRFKYKEDLLFILNEAWLKKARIEHKKLLEF